MRTKTNQSKEGKSETYSEKIRDYVDRVEQRFASLTEITLIASAIAVTGYAGVQAEKGHSEYNRDAAATEARYQAIEKTVTSGSESRVVQKAEMAAAKYAGRDELTKAIRILDDASKALRSQGKDKDAAKLATDAQYVAQVHKLLSAAITDEYAPNFFLNAKLEEHDQEAYKEMGRAFGVATRITDPNLRDNVIHGLIENYKDMIHNAMGKYMPKDMPTS